MKRKTLLFVAVALVVVVLGVVYVARKVHYVDPKPAATLGNEFFSRLQQRRITDAYALYTDAFRDPRGEPWRGVLTFLDERYGAVATFTLREVRTVPVADIPCLVVRYEVGRHTLSSEERLIVCPDKDGAHMAIAGHEITRSDNGAPTAAGVKLHEQLLFSTQSRVPSMEKRIPDAVRKLVDEFYNRMSAGQYDAIYDAASDDFKASASRDRVLQYLKRVEQRISSGCGVPTLGKLTVSPGADADLMYLAYGRKCNDRILTEGMSWKLMHGNAVLASVLVNSPDGSDLPLIDGERVLAPADLARTAREATDSFYQHVSAQDYDSLFALLSEKLRTPENQQMLVGLLQQVKQTTGTCAGPVYDKTSYTSSTAGLFVEVSCVHKCAERNVVENFTWKTTKDETLLDGYYVNGLTP